MDTSTTVSIITSSEEQHTRHMITQPPSARHSPGIGLWATLNVEETGLTRVALRVEAEAGGFHVEQGLGRLERLVETHHVVTRHLHWESTERTERSCTAQSFRTLPRRALEPLRLDRDSPAGGGIAPKKVDLLCSIMKCTHCID